MAVRIDAAADYLGVTTNPIQNSTFTMMFWFYLVSDRNASGNMAVLVNSNGTAFNKIFISTDGTTLAIDTSSSTPTTGTSLTVGVWYHIAWVKSDADHVAYLNGVSDVTHSGNPSYTTVLEALGGNTADYADARYASFKAWEAALTLAEVKQEIYQILPVRRTNIYQVSPFFAGSSERVRDYSGLGHNWTANGSLTDEAGPPVSWGIWTSPLPIFVAAGGPTTYNQSVSGTLTPSAALINQAQKVLLGSFTPTGTLVNQEQKVLTGAVTPTGGLFNQTRKVLSGSVIPTGILLNQGQKVLTGALIPTATLANQAQKVLNGSIAPVGTLINQTQKVLSGDLTPSGILATAKAALISLTGSLTPSGTLTNQAQKDLSGVLTPLGQLLKETQKVLTGSITPGGILTSTKTALISLVGSLTPGGTLVKETQKILSGTLTPTGSILKEVGKILSGILTPIGVLTASLVSTNLESTFKGMFRGIFRRMK